MHLIPLTKVPAQTTSVQLGGQSCQITLVQLGTGLYLDLFVEGKAILQGRLCHDRTLLIRRPYLRIRFKGADLSFYDTLGTDDPRFEGLGERWVLGYLPAEEVPAG